MDFKSYFLRGLKNTLRLQNGINFSSNGPWVSIFDDTIIDEFYVGDFMAAEYTIVVDGGNVDKEIIKAIVIAGPNEAKLTIYGRTSLQADMIDIVATVNASKVIIKASPVDSSKKKLYFSAHYYATINDLTRL